MTFFQYTVPRLKFFHYYHCRLVSWWVWLKWFVFDKIQKFTFFMQFILKRNLLPSLSHFHPPSSFHYSYPFPSTFSNIFRLLPNPLPTFLPSFPSQSSSPLFPIPAFFPHLHCFSSHPYFPLPHLHCFHPIPVLFPLPFISTVSLSSQCSSPSPLSPLFPSPSPSYCS